LPLSTPDPFSLFLKSFFGKCRPLRSSFCPFHHVPSLARSASRLSPFGPPPVSFLSSHPLHDGLGSCLHFSFWTGRRGAPLFYRAPPFEPHDYSSPRFCHYLFQFLASGLILFSYPHRGCVVGVVFFWFFVFFFFFFFFWGFGVYLFWGFSFKVFIFDVF